MLTPEETCTEQVDRGGSRWPMYQDCGRKAVVYEEGRFGRENEWHCKIHSKAYRDERERKNTERYNAKLAPRKYEWAAAAACKKLGLTLQELELGKLEEMVTRSE